MIAGDLGGAREVEAKVVATTLMGVHIALVELARALALAGSVGDGLAEAVKTQGARPLDRLEGGLHDFGSGLDDTPGREHEPPLLRSKSPRSS